MFSNQAYLDKKTGAHGYGRFPYLKQLVKEFQTTSDESSKKEVLANLANFSYDPINFDSLRKLNVPMIFVQCLHEGDDLVEFAASGLCNLAADSACARDIEASGGISGMINLLSCSREATVLAAVTGLYFMAFDQRFRKQISDPAVLACMEEFARCKNTRLRNVATVLLDHFPEVQKKLST